MGGIRKFSKLSVIIACKHFLITLLLLVLVFHYFTNIEYLKLFIKSGIYRLVESH